MSNEQAFEYRLKLLEQRMDVQAREVSQMSAEILKSMEGFSQGTSMALQVIAERLKALETDMESLKKAWPDLERKALDLEKA